MNYLVLSCSLNPNSRSRLLAREAYQRLNALGDGRTELLDLADLPLPMCDGANAYDNENAKLLKQRVVAAQGILIACPIYNFDVSATAKNAVELTGRDGWTGKVAGFLCSSGGQGSYMSVMQLANSLMLDFRTLIIPRFVYANYPDFDEDSVTNPEVLKRIDEVTRALVCLTSAVASLD